MKKILPIILCVLIAISVFMVGCSKNQNADDSLSPNQTTAMPTDKAKIKEADAINLISSYSNDELGIDDEIRKNEDFAFLVAASGVEESGTKCIKVIASIKEKHVDEETGNETFSFDTKGEYYISFDGKKIFRKDMTTGKYIDMKVKDLPTTTTTVYYADDKQ